MNKCVRTYQLECSNARTLIRDDKYFGGSKIRFYGNEVFQNINQLDINKSIQKVFQKSMTWTKSANSSTQPFEKQRGPIPTWRSYNWRVQNVLYTPLKIQHTKTSWIHSRCTTANSSRKLPSSQKSAPLTTSPTLADRPLPKPYVKIVADLGGTYFFGMLTPSVWNVIVRSHFIRMVCPD